VKKIAIALTLFLFLIGCGTSDVPEMKEFMKAISSQEQLATVIDQYAATADTVPDVLTHCKLGQEKILHTEERNSTVFYTVEATVEKCAKSKSAVGTIRVFDLGWKDGKIVDFNWHGPKSGKVEY